MRKTRGTLVLAVLLVGLTAQGTAAGGDDGDDDWIRTSGDIIQVALPVLGGGATFFTHPDPDRRWDREGTWQFARAYGTAWGSTYLIKIAAAKVRPNGTNRTSFPSGHTMSAFAGAGFIDGRYGRTFGIPAYALALFTGYSRVHSGWHYRDDVLAGGSIGLISNWLFVSPLPGKVQFVPTVSGDGYGLTVSVGGGGRTVDDGDDRPRNTGYRFTFGPAYVVSNVAGSKGAGEGTFTLSDLEGFNDPTTTATVAVGIPVSARGAVVLDYGPFEARDRGAFDRDVAFGGATFPAGTPVDSSWRHYDLNVSYEQVLLDDPRWGVRGAAGVGVMHSYVFLGEHDGATSALVEDTTFYPYLAIALEHRFSRRWALEGRVGGMTLGDDWTVDAGAEFTWRPVRAWDLALGYEYFSRRIDTDTFYNKVAYSTPYLSITRYW